MFLDDGTGVAGAAAGGGLLVVLYCIVCIAVCVFCIICMWKIYKKAGEPGWACIVPIYGEIVFYKIATGAWWKFFFLFIPVFGEIYAIIAIYKLSKAFGHGFGFFLGLFFLPVIFFPILAFGSSTYVGAE